MTFRVAQGHAQRHLRLIGELDVAEADSLIDDVRSMVEAQGDLTLDLKELEFIDSSGVRALVSIAGLLADGATLILRDPTSPVRRVLELVGIEQVAAAIEVQPPSASPG
jgi:anti-anti-sigma factor